MARYRNIPKIKTTDGTRLYRTVKYPDIPRSNSDVYVITEVEDRYDTLAQQYYEDPSLWWVISSANAQYPQASISPPVGVQLRIPGNLSAILEAYNIQNQ